MVSIEVEKEKRTWPSPSGPNTTPGTVATCARFNKDFCRFAAVNAECGSRPETRRTLPPAARKSNRVHSVRPLTSRAARDKRRAKFPKNLCRVVNAASAAHCVGVETPLEEYRSALRRPVIHGSAATA